MENSGSDSRASRPAVNEELWVELRRVEGRAFSTGNAHTHQGRMNGWSDLLQSGLSFSKNEVLAASPPAHAWIDGFLAGSEPEPHQVFGPAMHDAEDTDPRWDRWRAAVADYRASGSWAHTAWSDLKDFPAGVELPPFVWAIRGIEVWTWTGQRWTLADPQPARELALLVGTVCHARGHHELTMVSSIHSVCDDCGRTSEYVPDDFSSEGYERVRASYRATLITPMDSPTPEP